MVPVDDFSPMYVGDTQIPLSPSFLHKDLTPVNITGATISMKMKEIATQVVKSCSGTWIIDDPINGLAHYNWQSADVSIAGTWYLYVSVTISGATVHSDPKLLQILPTP